MGYKNFAHGTRLNAERAAAFAAPRKLHCPWCAINGHGHHLYILDATHTQLICPRCGDGHEASEAERRLYGGEA